mgnify:CR=1 FL=1
MAAPAFPAEASPIPVAPVVRKAPQLTTLARSAVGNRNYQQDALYVDSSKMLAANKKTRLLAVVCDGEEVIELVNPEIIAQSGEQSGPEGCLSVPGRYGIVTRPNVVRVRAQDREGHWFEVEGEELLARGFCHELEHLDGHLYTERVERYLTDEEIEEMMREEQ